MSVLLPLAQPTASSSRGCVVRHSEGRCGSKPVVTPLKRDVCITPESRHRSATLPIAIPSSATVERSSLTSTSPLKVRCIDSEIFAWLERHERRRAETLNGDYDAFSRGTHKAGVSAQIEARFMRFKARKDHRRLAVRTERTLASRFSMKKRRNGTIEHNTLHLGWAGARRSQSPIDAGTGR